MPVSTSNPKSSLEEILAEWEEDCAIPPHQIDETQRKTPNLHAKYMRRLAEWKLFAKSAENARARLEKDKWLYYSGKMDEETLRKKGWEPDPFNGLNVLKGDREHWRAADPDIQEMEEKTAVIKTTIATLEEIIQTLRWRHSTIKNIIDFRRFESGA